MHVEDSQHYPPLVPGHRLRLLGQERQRGIRGAASPDDVVGERAHVVQEPEDALRRSVRLIATSRTATRKWIEFVLGF